MKTGTLILAMHSDIEGEKTIAERIKNHLISQGRKNVYIGFHHGKPDCYDIFLEMNGDGVDTYCIIPLVFSEGKQTIWNMPKHLTLPDNSGSWTMIGKHDVATRFSTAIGYNENLAQSILKELGTPTEEDLAILLCRGSPLSICSKTLAKYSEFLIENGWETATVVAKNDESYEILQPKFSGKSLHIIPFTVTTEGKSVSETIEKISSISDRCRILKPIFQHNVVLEIIDSKVPEDW